MSKIYTGNSRLKKDAHSSLITGIIFLIPLILYVIAFVTIQFHLPGIMHLVPMVVFGWPAAHFLNRYNTLKSGINGEEKTLRAVSSLPDTYHVFSNINIPFDGRNKEMDLLVVGINGVFIIEVKNHNGTIVGNTEDNNWQQHKVGRKGGQYSSSLRNPLKQVGGQVFALSRTFKSMNINSWIEGIVYFSNEAAELNITGNNKSIFTSCRELNSFIEGYQPRKLLDATTINKIVEFLKTKQ